MVMCWLRCFISALLFLAGVGWLVWSWKRHDLECGDWEWRGFYGFSHLSP